MKKLLTFLDSLDFSPVTMIMVILGLSVMRLFLENFSSPEATGLFAPFVGIISYASLYGMLILIAGFVLSFFSKKSLLWSLRVIILIFPVILLTPIIDLAVSGGAGFCIGYAQSGSHNLFSLFIHLLAPHKELCGITPGLRFQIIAIVVGLAGLVGVTTRSAFRTVGMAIGAYIVAFIGGALPNLISSTFATDATSSLLSTIHYPTDSLFFTPITSTITTVLLGRVQLLIFFVLVLATWGIISQRTWVGWWKGFFAKLPLAFIHVTIVIFGMWVGALTQPQALAWPDMIGVVLTILALLFACSFVGIENDINDFAIDTVSNKSWWLIDQKMSVSQLRIIQSASLIFAIVSAFLINHNVLFGIIAFIATYGIHSGGPRLKRFWVTSTFLITLSGVIAFTIGFFTLSPAQSAHGIPLLVLLMVTGILIPYSIIKDLPDIAGDLIGNIKTFPISFGKQTTLITVFVLLVAWLVIFWNIIPWFFALGVIIPIIVFRFKPRLVYSKQWVLGLPVGIWFVGILIHTLF